MPFAPDVITIRGVMTETCELFKLYQSNGFGLAVARTLCFSV